MVFNRNLTELKVSTHTRTMNKLRECVRKPTRPNVVNGKDWVIGPKGHTGINHLLGAALHFWVTSLNRIKIKLRRIYSRIQRTGSATAKANSHARPTQLNQQGPHWDGLLKAKVVVNDPNTTR